MKKKLRWLIVWLGFTTMSYGQYKSCCEFTSNYATCNSINIIGECRKCPSIPEKLMIEWRDQEGNLDAHFWEDLQFRTVTVDHKITELQPNTEYEIIVKVKMKGWMLWTQIGNFKVATDCDLPPPNDDWTASTDREKGWLVGDFNGDAKDDILRYWNCLLYTSPSPRDLSTSRMPSSA